MKYKFFKKKLQKYPYFTSAIYTALGGSEKTIYNQVNKWIQTGDVIKLRKGLYTLNSEDRRVGLSRKLTANILYSPSYISLEYALSFYGLIPEAVYIITSVSTKKTQTFTNNFGKFIYRSLKKEAFFGYNLINDEFGFGYLMAAPEKALLDYLYFHILSMGKVSHSYFEDSLRLQNTDQLNIEIIIEMAKKMKSQKIIRTIKILKEWMTT